MTPQELKDWATLREQHVNGWHMSENDWRELVRLNHLVMEASHDIHNTNMLRKDEKNPPCPKCGRELAVETELDYPWQCLTCDENFYNIELRKDK